MKVLYTATVASHICQFHLPYMKRMKEMGWEIHVAAEDNLAQKKGLTLEYTDQFHRIPFRRNPLKWGNLKAYRQLKALICREKYDLILCNTPVGGILTRLAAGKARKQGTKVVYIAHGFHFYRGAPKRNWLLYYPLEKWMAPKCDLLITLNREDYTLAKERFSTSVARIHGIGASDEKYHPVSARENAVMRENLGLSENDFVLLCTGELNRNKDQKTLLRAAAAVKEQIPSLKILLAGNGPMERELKLLTAELNLQEHVIFLGYRRDLERVVPCVDMAVSCSHREGLPLNVVEAMLCGKPVIAAENRGTRELLLPGENGLLFSPGDAKALAKAILDIRESATGMFMGRNGEDMGKHYGILQVSGELMLLLTGLLQVKS